MTGRDAVAASLRLLGVLASGETSSAAEATDGLSALNRMLGSWSAEGSMVPFKVREEFTLTPGTASYTMGPSGVFNTTRPIDIERATIEIQSSTPVSEYPVRIVTIAEWAAIGLKDLASDVPTDLYPEGTYPLETLNLYPVPSVANKLVLYSMKALTAIATLDTAVSLPPGYDRAIIYNLAVELAPEYGKAVPDTVAMVAMESKATLMRLNDKPRYLGMDSALVSNGYRFDILRGDTL